MKSDRFVRILGPNQHTGVRFAEAKREVVITIDGLVEAKREVQNRDRAAAEAKRMIVNTIEYPAEAKRTFMK